MSGVADERTSPLLRLAGEDDSRLVYDWRNDPWIVSLSTSRRPVTWEEHQAWFPRMLNRADHLLFIIHFPEGTPAGTVRLDREGEQDAVVTIYLLRSFTGRGLGPRALQRACAQAFERWPDLKRITAHVRADNEPSRKAFARTGFVAHTGDPGCPADHVSMVKWRDQP
jgi:RimJ/RimL family protein N-acetyltransferase